MSTNAIIAVAVATIVVIGGGVWYFSSHSNLMSSDSSGAAATSTATSTETPASSTSSGSSSIASLISRGGNYECTVTSAAQKVSGTLDVSGTRLKASFTMTQNGKTIRGYMIDDGTTVYSWSDAASQGVKLPAANGSAQSEIETFSKNTDVSYSCVPWTPTANAFVPPTNITFMALGGQQ